MWSETISRRGFLAGAAGLTSVVALGASPPPASAAGLIAFGAYTDGMDAHPQRLNNLSIVLREPLSIASVFRGPGDVWPGPVEAALAANRTLLVAWYLDHHSCGPTRAGRRCAPGQGLRSSRRHPALGGDER